MLALAALPFLALDSVAQRFGQPIYHLIFALPAIALLQFQISPPKTDIENNVVISDYAQMDRILKVGGFEGKIWAGGVFNKAKYSMMMLCADGG
jgi:hypothetical protein